MLFSRIRAWVLTLGAVASLCACVVNPERPKTRIGNEEGLTCTQLADAIDTAKRQQAAAEKEDHFKYSYMFPPTGMISVYNIMRAKEAAKDRLDYLNSIAAGKGCYRGPDISNFINDGAFRPTFDQARLNAANRAYVRRYDTQFDSMPYYRKKPGFTFRRSRSVMSDGYGFD